MIPADILDDLARCALRAGARSDTLNFLAEQRRAAAVLLFRECAPDAAGRRVFAVGVAGGELVAFTPASAGVALWFEAVRARPVGVAVSGRSAEATRKVLARGLVEIEAACPALAHELRASDASGTGAAVYAPTRRSPPIVTE